MTTTKEDAAIAWQREHTTHPTWCANHAYGDGSGAGVHQPALFRADRRLSVALVAADEEEPEVRVIAGASDVCLSPASVEPPCATPMRCWRRSATTTASTERTPRHRHRHSG